MPDTGYALIAGLIAGLVSSAIMEAYQAFAAEPFGQDLSTESSTVKAADTLSKAVHGNPIAQPNRKPAGRLVHYATGLALGLLYGWLALVWPPVTWGFGIAYGLVVAIVLDYVAVPAFGWGSPAWKTPLSTHLYSLSAHVVFGIVLEAIRQIAGMLIAT